MALLRVNPDFPIYFDGWESSTAKLGARGWNISVNEEYHNRGISVFLYHEASGIKLIAEDRSFDKYRFREIESYRAGYYSKYEQKHFPDLVVKQATGSKMFVSPKHFDFIEWNNTRPAIIEVKDIDVMETPLFTKLSLPAPQELIVEPAEVQDLLDKIMKMQAPAQADIRKKRPVEVRPMATILSFGT